MAIKSCYGCVAPKRHPGCHDHCQEYIQEKIAYEEKKAAEHKRKSIEDGLDSQAIKGVYRARKIREGRWK